MRGPNWADTSFRTLLDAAPDAMLIVNRLGDVVVANAQAEKLFRYTREQLVGLPVESLIPPRLRDRHPQHRENFFGDPRVRPMGAGLELFALRGDGTEIPVEISLSPFTTESETFVISAIRDVTERRHAEQKFRGLLESAPDAMVIVERSGTIVLANSQTESLFGYSRTELLGKSVEMLIPARYRQRHTGHRNTFFTEPKIRPMGQGLELFGLRRDGTEFPVEISLSPLNTEEGTYVTAAIRDISERKRIEQEIQTLNLELRARVEELAASNRELEAFSYSVSHDLRAPLRQIDGFSKILLEEAPDSLSADLLEYLAQVREGTRHMGRLIDDLLNFARLGRTSLVKKIVDLDGLVRSVAMEIQGEAQGRDVRWKIDQLPSAECDDALMRQVFLNLMSNAVKFTRTREHAEIEIGETQEEGRQVFFVRDNGVGFNMKYADKLFGVFQRLHLQDEFEGTGVGLAMVHRIILKHGGRIWFRAEPERGATFFFTLGKVQKELSQEIDI
jgi:PAS domain S-box-containing protein